MNVSDEMNMNDEEILKVVKALTGTITPIADSHYEEVLFKAQHENKLKTILQKHNIDNNVINEIIKEYYLKNGGY